MEDWTEILEAGTKLLVELQEEVASAEPPESDLKSWHTKIVGSKCMSGSMLQPVSSKVSLW